jgi:hypothetical protein
MCDGLGRPASVTQALAMLDRALDHLAAADAASLPSAVQAEALRALERAGAKQVAVRSRVLAAFASQAAYEDDGQGSARAWLRWQTRVTNGAAGGAVGWLRRLAEHPVIGDALAAGDLSESWARQVCAWTDRLPPARHDEADEILAAAARAGVDLPGLAGLAQEMFERSWRERGDGPPDGFGGRAVCLGTTLGGAGKLTGDLTAGCSAALAAVLEALGKRAGPEDIRSAAQRRHDALEEACRRLIASGMLPGRAGQPTQIVLHMTLSQLRDIQDGSAAEAAWAAARASQPGWVTGPEAEAAACDASVVPIVTGHLDLAALDKLTEIYLATRAQPSDTAAHPGSHTGRAGSATPHNGPAAGQPGSAAGHPGTTGPPDRTGRAAGGTGDTAAAAASPPGPASPSTGPAGTAGGGNSPASTTAAQPTHTGARAGPPADGSDGGGQSLARAGAAEGEADGCGCRCGGCDCPPAPLPPSPPGPPLPGPADRLSPQTRDRVRRALLGLAADALSGPGGLADQLRSGLGGPLAAVSLPLDVGPATETIPAHLRRAVTVRHPHCAFPGCEQPASVCDIHHIIPRSRGGPTALSNLLTMCSFHHKIVIHRWGWNIRLNSDGTTTATSRGGHTLHSHSPPSRAA